MELVERLRTADRRATARLITMIENGDRRARPALAALYPHTGRAHVVGVTGYPGTGKSTLVNQMAQVYRHRNSTVGIIAIDPTSPFSGGAFLGDRVRMSDLSGDEGIFIRSMATRGRLGGLAAATADAIKVLDAAGYQVIFVETVGVGQTEVDIAQTAHTTLVVEVPGLGDEIQAIKAGLLEIADIFVVNKADRAGADNAVLTLQTMLDTGCSDLDWQPPIYKTSALRGEGIEAVVQAIDRHLAYLQESQTLYRREKARVERELDHIIQQELTRRFLDQVQKARLDGLIECVTCRKMDPYTAVEELLENADRRRRNEARP